MRPVAWDEFGFRGRLFLSAFRLCMHAYINLQIGNLRGKELLGEREIREPFICWIFPGGTQIGTREKSICSKHSRYNIPILRTLGIFLRWKSGMGLWLPVLTYITRLLPPSLVWRGTKVREQEDWFSVEMKCWDFPPMVFLFVLLRFPSLLSFPEERKMMRSQEEKKEWRMGGTSFSRLRVRGVIETRGDIAFPRRSCLPSLHRGW